MKVAPSLAVDALAPGNDRLAIDAIIEFPLHRLRVVALDFLRDAAFPDAVARVVVEDGVRGFIDPGAHVSTPWGMVQVVDRAT